MVIPLFKSHYSIGRSILTLGKEDSSIGSGPDSIMDICKKNQIKDLFLIDDNMGGFLEAYTNCQSSKINFKFGLRITVCADRAEKNEDARLTESKYVIFANNTEGYKKLIKIYTVACKEGFYYVPRIDHSFLKDIWNDEDLSLAIPFYDSFLHKNSLHGSLCLPSFDYTSPVFFKEDNNLFLDKILEEKVKDFCEANGNETHQAKSIYYKNKSDFISYLTFRCINNRSDLNKPELEYMSSNDFCVENWKEQNGSA
jgi:DNA polymerase III alpha subunit